MSGSCRRTTPSSSSGSSYSWRPLRSGCTTPAALSLCMSSSTTLWPSAFRGNSSVGSTVRALLWRRSTSERSHKRAVPSADITNCSWVGLDKVLQTRASKADGDRGEQHLDVVVVEEDAGADE